MLLCLVYVLQIDFLQVSTTIALFEISLCRTTMKGKTLVEHSKDGKEQRFEKNVVLFRKTLMNSTQHNT